MTDKFRDNTPYFHKSNGSGESEWKLRVFQRRNTFDRLKQEGRLAVLGLSSILTGLDFENDIMPLEEYSNARLVFKESLMYKIHSYKTNLRVAAIPTKEYQRAEEGFQSFMGVVILSIKDIDNLDVVKDFFELKKWVYRQMSSSAMVDQVLTYLKYLTKVCQALFLRSQIPERESYFPTINGNPTPFNSGGFAFVNDLLKQGVRTQPLNKVQAYTLSQMASGTRALPYPSKHIVSKQIIETCQLITNKHTLDEETKRSHRGGVKQILERLHEPKDYQVHISLSSSASDELPKSEGGKAAWLVSNAKSFCEQDISPELIQQFTGTFDCFGFEVLNAATAAQVIKKKTDPENLLDIKVGDILYLEAGEAITYLDSLDVSEKDRLPKDLCKILLLEASREVLKFGTYNKPFKHNSFNLPLFTEISDELEFHPTVQEIPVTASLSIESALKSRLVTAAPAGYTEIGQTINNFMRNYLSQDEFLKVGFEEPDKLWEVLKAYERSFYQPPKE